MKKKLGYCPKYYRRLPHIQPPNTTFFITFRLAGSLPVHIIRQLTKEDEQNRQKLLNIGNPRNRDRMTYLESRKQFERWDNALHRPDEGPTWLGREDIARNVSDCIHFFEDERYLLDCYNIMPNHVHLVFTPLKKDNGTYWAISEIMHSIKSYSAQEANRILGRTGAFWHPENYDHAVRDEEELNRIVRYVLNNPVKAGFVKKWDEWKWGYCRANL